jgi:hypothetical protein
MGQDLMPESQTLKINVDVLPVIAAAAKPGDTIMIGFDRTLTDQELEDLREGFAGFTATTGVHIAFIEHATSMVVVEAER